VAYSFQILGLKRMIIQGLGEAVSPSYKRRFRELKAVYYLSIKEPPYQFNAQFIKKVT